MRDKRDLVMEFLVLWFCVAALGLLVYALIKADPAHRDDRKGPPTLTDPESPTRHLPGRMGRRMADDFRWSVYPFSGPSEELPQPLRGWWRVTGFIVVVAFIAGFAYAMASGDYSGQP